ncbi:unnamed protein product, partial [Amoebophrya sp. A25]|eukprot:GSA25T00007037001.1
MILETKTLFVTNRQQKMKTFLAPKKMAATSVRPPRIVEYCRLQVGGSSSSSFRGVLLGSMTSQSRCLTSSSTSSSATGGTTAGTPTIFSTPASPGSTANSSTPTTPTSPWSPSFSFFEAQQLHHDTLPVDHINAASRIPTSRTRKITHPGLTRKNKKPAPLALLHLKTSSTSTGLDVDTGLLEKTLFHEEPNPPNIARGDGDTSCSTKSTSNSPSGGTGPTFSKHYRGGRLPQCGIGRAISLGRTLDIEALAKRFVKISNK